MKVPLKVRFERGTLAVDTGGVSTESAELALRHGERDERSGEIRLQAMHYGTFMTELHRSGHPYEDQVLAFARRDLKLDLPHPPRAYQTDALKAWMAAGRRGTVVLPTGSGKSILAMMAIEKSGRDTLIIVPTLDLLDQWVMQLKKSFSVPIGRYGGGEKELQTITVSTYDSALMFMEHFGNRFGLLVADECHHLPGQQYQWIARTCIAPFRLGLSATPRREDGGERLLDTLIGRVVYAREILEMRGNYLAHYQTHRVSVQLNADEARRYRDCREMYLGFAHEKGIDMGAEDGWSTFMRLSQRSTTGRAAYAAWREQRGIARSCAAKFEALFEIMIRHREAYILVFTDDNATAYGIGERFGLPVLTHHTRASERRNMLEQFRQGVWPCLVTSRVLNEGVDVPEASVGVVVSGTGSVREHVQRLGRILRPGPGKRAELYELITEATGEIHTSLRRRRHDAYEKSASL